MNAEDEGNLDPAVVTALFEEYGEELRRFLIGVLRDSQLANDAVQAAFAKMVERGHQTREETRKAWLFRVAYNEAMLVRRKQVLSRSLLERVAWSRETEVAGPDDPLLRGENVERVKAAIDGLPPNLQRIVQMRIYEEKTFAVIAQELKIPLGTALGRMRTALSRLRTILEEE